MLSFGITVTLGLWGAGGGWLCGLAVRQMFAAVKSVCAGEFISAGVHWGTFGSFGVSTVFGDSIPTTRLVLSNDYFSFSASKAFNFFLLVLRSSNFFTSSLYC